MRIDSTGVIRPIACCSAIGLVIASAGFGAVYAWRVGFEHSYLLAALSVTFAIALELTKPLAVHGALQAFGGWSPVRAIALALLALVAVVYNLTSELALMSTSRVDLTASRASEAYQAKANMEKYERARQELTQLKPSRPVSELEALVAAAPSHCRIVVGHGVRDTVCQKPGALLAELGRAKRRVELEAVIQAIPLAQHQVAVADPGAASLAVYLSALGITVPVETVATWLNLVPVIALELGSALAGVLVASVSPRVTVTQAVSQPRALVAASVPQLPASDLGERHRVASQIVSHLRANGGQAEGSHRSLGKLLGADRNTVSRALRGLATSGVIAVQATRQGSVLKLS
jgi:hypothetical protein